MSTINTLKKNIAHQENSDVRPLDECVSDVLNQFNAEYVASAWKDALERRKNDPSAAITSARSLIESTCKHILDELSVPYEDGLELPKLYKLTANELGFAPSKDSEKTFKQLFGGCLTAVESLGAVRNRLSDSHGKGKLSASPSPRHAELCVNLSGTMATFLIQTYLEQHTHIPNLVGNWKGSFCGGQIGVISIKQNGKKLSATLTTSSKNGNVHDEVISEELEGEIDGFQIILHGISVHNTEEGFEPNYNLDSFILALSTDGKILSGTVEDGVGEYSADFTKQN